MSRRARAHRATRRTRRWRVATPVSTPDTAAPSVGAIPCARSYAPDLYFVALRQSIRATLFLISREAPDVARQIAATLPAKSRGK
jgi:hypothetical protein